MSEQAPSDVPPKTDPETLVLRVQPRKVVRFKRSLLIGIASFGAAAIFAATWFALRASSGHPVKAQELYNIDRKKMPDNVAKLPPSYDKVKLGPPLPGDLGPAVLAREKSVGISSADMSFKPNPEDDAARAERIRLAQQARQADEAGVLFQTSNRSGASAPGTVVQTASPAQPAETSVVTANTAGINLDPSRDPNSQGRKLDLVSGKPDKNTLNPHALQTPVSPYELLAGTIISASLITGLNSDLPGTVVAQVTEDTYDTAKGRYLLLPRGSRLIGVSDSVIAFGQRRALVVWQRIVMPNGTSIQIDNLPATDAAGYTGLEDKVDYHTWTLLKGIAMSTLLGVGTQATFGGNNSDLVEAIRQSAQESTSQAGQRIVEKDLNIQPTITVRPGWPLRVILNKDCLLQPYSG
jgi:type IV secretion system protein VirB10